jgi:hypothetical protein
MSAPAAKARVPAPVRTIARHASSRRGAQLVGELVEEVEAQRVQRLWRSIVTSATPSRDRKLPPPGTPK